jgi:hypothetical protein
MNSISNILPKIKQDYPEINFQQGDSFFWTPKDKKITYATHQDIAEHGVWSLLHEVSHAQLEHKTYENDFELLKIESSAWQTAKKIGKKYGVNIDLEHIQDCLDTYRDWLHHRASCPNCDVVTIQRDDGMYQCFNCRTAWKVPKSPLCRVTKRVIAE